MIVFLIGYSDSREKTVVFKVYRMEMPETTQESRVPQPDDFRIRNYTEKVFWIKAEYRDRKLYV